MSEVTVVDVWPLGGIVDWQEGSAPASVPELRFIESDWATIVSDLAGSSQLSHFTERLHREWSIETGQIENLYDIDRGVTQTLIEQGFDAAYMKPGAVNKDPHYIKNLLQDQQDALEGLFAFVRGDRSLSTGYVKELHAAMTRSQAKVDAVDPSVNHQEVDLIHGDYKKQPNYPRRNGNVFRYSPPEQTASEMDRLVQVHHQQVSRGDEPEVVAVWLHHRFTQIHPFQDGNGRVARALATLVLIKAGLFPLVIPREEKGLYLDMLEQADSGDAQGFVNMVGRLQQGRFERGRDLLRRTSPPSP